MGTDRRGSKAAVAAKPPDSLEGQLFETGSRFDFFQATRLLEQLYPDRVPVGEGSEPSRETVRFKSRVSLGFPGADIDIINQREDEPAEMWVNLMGLAGQFGPLPQAFTELIIRRNAKKNFAPRDFLDIFNHRLISLLARIRKKHRLALAMRPPDQTPFSGYLFSLLGLGTEGLRSRQSAPDRVFLKYTGLLLNQSRSMPGLRSLLTDFFRVPVKCQQFCGQWLSRDEPEWTRIGGSGQNRTLGRNAMLGRRVWDQNNKFRVFVGPMPRETFDRFLPGGEHYETLDELTRFYVGQIHEYELTLRLDQDHVEGARLGYGGPDGVRLGWTSWLSADQLARRPAVRVPAQYKNLLWFDRPDEDAVAANA